MYVHRINSSGEKLISYKLPEILFEASVDCPFQYNMPNFKIRKQRTFSESDLI